MKTQWVWFMLFSAFHAIHGCADEDTLMALNQARVQRGSVEATFDQTGERIVRTPTFTLRFEGDLQAPSENAVWLFDGPLTESLISDARRASLSASNSSKRLAASIEFDPRQRRILRVRPRNVLMPGQTVSLISTGQLLDRTGRTVSASPANNDPLKLTAKVCASPDCPAIATLIAPLAEEVPLSTRVFTLRFDRPIHPVIEGPVAFFESADGEEVPGVAYLSCPVGLHWECIQFAPDVALSPHQEYHLRLGALGDVRELPVLPQTLVIHTGTDEHARAPLAVDLPSCRETELRRGPFCLALTHHSLSVRALLDSPGQLRVRSGELTVDSPVGTLVSGTLHSIPPNAHMPLLLTTVGLDGVASRDYRVESIQSLPTSPRVRITEVYSRPRGSSAQEFLEIELLQPPAISLATLTLRTNSGVSRLPEVMLAPGVRAVIVGPTFDVAGDQQRGDPPLAAGALLVRLPQRLAQRGLTDRGTDVWIADVNGAEISRAPTATDTRAPRLGVSLVRADSEMLENDPASWMYDAQEGASPGGVDRIR